MRRRKFRRNGGQKFVGRKHRRINAILKLLLIPLLGAAIVSAGYIIFFSPVFAISKVHVKTEQLSCATGEDLRIESHLRGEHFFKVNSSEVEKRLQEKFFCVKSASIEKQFPSTLTLSVSSRRGAAILMLIKESTGSAKQADKISTDSAQASASALPDLSSMNPSDSFLVDSEGVIFSKNMENTNVPRLYLLDISNLSLGKKISGGLIESCLKIFDRLKTLGVTVTEGQVLTESTLVITSKPKLFFALKGDLETQLASLQLILEKAKIDEEVLEFVDLRFDKPVVKYAPKPKKKNP